MSSAVHVKAKLKNNYFLLNLKYICFSKKGTYLFTINKSQTLTQSMFCADKVHRQTTLHSMFNKPNTY